MNVTFTLNGRERTLDVPPHVTLLHLLRETLGIFDAKEGCDEGVCGACTVLMDGRPVSSCLVLAPMTRGKSVITLRGIALRAGERTGAGVPGARGEHVDGRAGERTGAGVPGARGEHFDDRTGAGLHPLQDAFLVHGAVQCGFCTPGMVLTALAFVERHPDADREAVRHAIEGNLCRCTGYTKIVDAVVAYAREARRG